MTHTALRSFFVLPQRAHVQGIGKCASEVGDEASVVLNDVSVTATAVGDVLVRWWRDFVPWGSEAKSSFSLWAHQIVLFNVRQATVAYDNVGVSTSAVTVPACVLLMISASEGRGEFGHRLFS